MLPYLREHHADPGRLHAEGQITRVAIEEARESGRRRSSAPDREKSCSRRAAPRRSTPRCGVRSPRLHGAAGHIVTTAVEHSAVLDACARASGRRHRDRCRSSGPVRRRRGARRDPRPTPRWSRCSSPTTRSGRSRPAADDRGRGARARRHRPRRRVRGRRARAGRLRRRSAPTCARSPRTSSAARRAPARSSCGAVCGSPPSCVGGAQERARRGGIEDVPAIVGLRRRGGGAGRRRAGTGSDAARAHTDASPREGDAERRARRRPIRRPDRAPPPPRVPRRRRRRGRAGPARARPARRRRALGLVVLERGARAVTGARGDGRRRRPVAPRQRRLELDRRRRRRVPGRLPGNRRAISRGLAEPHDPGTATQPRRPLRARRGRRRPTSTRRRLDFQVVANDGIVRCVHTCGRRPTITTISALFSVGPDAPGPERGTRWPLPLGVGGADDRRPRRRTRAPCARWARCRVRAITASRKSLYGQDIDGNEFEVHVERAARGMGRRRARTQSRNALDLASEVARYGTSRRSVICATCPKPDWSQLASELTSTLAPRGPAARDHLLRFAARGRRRRSPSPMPGAMPDGRTGRVPAGCVFWMKATESTFCDRRRGPRQLLRRAA